MRAARQGQAPPVVRDILISLRASTIGLQFAGVRFAQQKRNVLTPISHQPARREFIFIAPLIFGAQPPQAILRAAFILLCALSPPLITYGR